MTTIEQIAAEILIGRSYADGQSEDGRIYHEENWTPYMSHEKAKRHESVDPFADTLEGRRQADVIEDWFDYEHPNLWVASVDAVKAPMVLDKAYRSISEHQWRLDRIKWCLEQLISERTAKTAPQTD